MALQTMKAKISGTSALLLHNGIIANPLHPIAKAMKKLTGKRNKTDADYALIADLEWLAGWYFDSPVEFLINNDGIAVGDHGAFIIPDYVLDAVLVNGAKKSKLGMQFKSGVWVDGHGKLEFDGVNQPIDEMFLDPNLRLTTLETIGKARIVRTRPFMKQWSVAFAVNYDDTVVDQTQIEQSLDVAGRLVGLCERRPRYGRFAYKVS